MQFLYPPNEPIIMIEREFDAPRQLVWDAFTRPEHIAAWWGPRKYKIHVLEHDFREGGKWRISHTGGGKTHVFFGKILEIAAPERLVQTFGFLDFPHSTNEFTLVDLGARTKFEALMSFDSMASRDGMAASGMEGGAVESYERLDDLLEALCMQPV
jgi:uncharacterized protein YndB with AHSA1/START domain